MTEHTPWETWERPEKDCFNHNTGHYTIPADFVYIILPSDAGYIEIHGKEQEAVADKILKCVNAHDDLIEVLKLSTDVLEAVHAAESRDDAREMLGKLIMANRAVLEKTNA